MMLFNPKFVHFMWDDSLEGKKGFIGNYVCAIEHDVNNSSFLFTVHRGTKENPFMSDGIKCRFFYYDPNYEVKRAYAEGKTIQIENENGEWVDTSNPCWIEGGAYRVKPEVHVVLDNNGNWATTSDYSGAKHGYSFKTFEDLDEAVEWTREHSDWSKIAKAWVVGKDVQWRGGGMDWIDCECQPQFDNLYYRIKPEEEKWCVVNTVGHGLQTIEYEDAFRDGALFQGTKEKCEDWIVKHNKEEEAKHHINIKVDHLYKPVKNGKLFESNEKPAEPTFQKELKSLLNRYGMDNECETPDFILRDYLCDCLKNYKNITKCNMGWHGWIGMGEILTEEGRKKSIENALKFLKDEGVIKSWFFNGKFHIGEFAADKLADLDANQRNALIQEALTILTNQKIIDGWKYTIKTDEYEVDVSSKLEKNEFSCGCHVDTLHGDKGDFECV